MSMTVFRIIYYTRYASLDSNSKCCMHVQAAASATESDQPRVFGARFLDSLASEMHHSFNAEVRM